MSLDWDYFDVLTELAAAVETAEQALRLEQAVYGLDSLNELQLQVLLAGRLQQKYEVAREVHYPSSRGRKRTHRQRCDLVLTPKSRPLRCDWAEVALFDPPDQAEPADALWLEVKTAYQFRQGGVRHSGYGAQWRHAIVSDLRKMECEESIHHAGLVLIVFNESREILDKDLDLFELVLAQQEVLSATRQVRSIPILERIGHRLCTVALWPTIQR